MHLKRYRGKTLKDALRAVRQDLGPGALVLSTQVVQDRGPRGWIGGTVIEIAAAIERPDVSDLRHTVKEPLDRHVEALAARLGASGLEASVARAVAESHPAEHRRLAGAADLHSTLAEQLRGLAALDDDFAPVEVFVGPPGAGKTTTIAKIAAQERARTRRPVALVAADGFRPGAVDQLRCYANVLGAPFRAARSASELGAALDAARHPAFVDTAGRSPSDPELADLIGVFEPRKNVRTHLVLAANTTPTLANRLLDKFMPFKPSRVVITKLDEAESVLPLFNVLRERALLISFLAMGQRVPEDLERATPASLAAALLQEPIACH
jgi:flagellar biosynthesis protein FlhF